MRPSRRYLQMCCELQLHKRGVKLEPGVRIARGYADLGFEVFMLLSSTRMVSLHTGDVSEFGAGEQEHFFVVPDCEEMVEALLRLNFDVDSIHFPEQREWSLRLRNLANDALVEVRGESLEEMLAAALARGFELREASVQS